MASQTDPRGYQDTLTTTPTHRDEWLGNRASIGAT